MEIRIDDPSFESGFAPFIIGADLDSMLQPITSVLGGPASKALSRSHALQAGDAFFRRGCVLNRLAKLL